MNKKKKKILISTIAVVLVIAIAGGTWFGLSRRNSEPVYVFEFYNVGMTEFWGDTQESYGPVSTDNIQTVFLSETQTVTQVLVEQGDVVRKGDLLMTFDTTLSDLELERKRLEVEKLKLQLEDEKQELNHINSLRPMVIKPADPSDQEENLGTGLSEPYKLPAQREYDGSTPEKPLVVWVRSDTNIDSTVFEAVRQQAEKFQNLNRDLEGSSASAPQDGETPPEGGETPPEGGETPPEGGETPPEGSETPPEGGETPPEGSETPPEGSETPPEGSETPPEGSETPPEPIVVNACYVIFKVTDRNMSLGHRTVWQGVHLIRGNGYSFRFFDAAAVPDYTMVDEGQEQDGPDIDMGSGMTAGQIAQLRAEQQKKIKEVEFNIRMAEANYKIAKAELDDGNIHADFDGTVVSLLTPEEAKLNHQPMMKISGGGGFLVEGSVNELAREDMVIGQEVQISDWNTGMIYTGTVQSVGEFPKPQDYYGGRGNPNSSMYPFTVFVDESADLQAGSYVSIQYSAGTSENGVYLEKPFLRTEGGKSYVYVQGEDGRLEQRFVTTGKSLWGSYTEITGGLSPEDLIAFPYGKNVKPGAAAVLGDMSDLYE